MKQAFERIRTCIINGIEMHYHLCAQEKDAYKEYTNLNLEYLGTGQINLIDGINQKSQRVLHFWKIVTP